jgi:hypothetical protein
VFACIGSLPDTLADRCVIIQMQRRTEQQSVERFLHARAQTSAEPIRESLTAWATDQNELVRTAYELMPDLGFLKDRNAEVWMPLFAVCSVVAPERVRELERCAEMLTGAKEAEDADDSLSLKLLTDVRSVWCAGNAHVATATLLKMLRDLTDSPWAENDLTSRRLSKMLRPFGVSPRQIRPGSDITLKGYVLSEFEQAFSRYLTTDSV